ncbi:MAG: AraC family transcriptional regulator [Terrimicrobiaceae bacterium]
MEPFITDCLEQWLRSPLTFHDVRTLKYASSYTTGSEIISTHRFVLVLRGELHYTVEGVTAKIPVGHQIFTPAWVRREIHPRPHSTCECIWCEFSADSVEFDASSLFFRKCRNPGLERAALARMLKIWPGPRILADFSGNPAARGALPRAIQLRLEGELKAMLVRFWAEATPWNRSSPANPTPSLHPELKRAVIWMREHYMRPTALPDLYKEIHLSPNHFRLLFHQIMQCSPQDYLIGMRMRRARFLVLSGEYSFKEVAALIGFSDPSFFSRQYHRFFGVSPRADRSRSLA